MVNLRTVIARLAPLVTGAVAALAGALFLLLPWSWFLDALSYDLLSNYRIPPLPADIVILYLDEDAHRELKQPPQGPWDRAIHVRLLKELREKGAKLAAFDILFDQPWKDPAVDEAFAREMQLHGKVLLASTLHQGDVVSIIAPAAVLRANSQFGLIDLPAEPDRVLRRHLSFTDHPTFAEQAARMLAASPPSAPPEWWLRFYGPPLSVAHASYHKVFEDRALPPNFFRNKIVVIGMARVITPTGQTTDTHSVPTGRWSGERAAGAEVQATAIANLLRGEYVTRVPPFAELGLLLMCGFALSVCAVRPPRALICLPAVLILIASLAIFLFANHQLWFDWLIPFAVQLPAAFVLATVFHVRRIGREKALLEERIAAAMRSETIVERPEEARTVQSSRSASGQPPIPDHELLRCVGSGGYGEVWLARDIIGTYHAVKIIYRDRFSDAEPYEREFRGIQKFTPISRSHPGLIHILHVGRSEAHRCFFYIMEPGDDEKLGQNFDPATYQTRSLGLLLQRARKLPVAEVLDLGLSLSATLDYLHKQNLIHRDIKPSNIIYVQGVPKFADVGLVTELSNPHRADTSYVGTQGYISPEGPGSALADIFSLGKVLYEAAMGMDRMQFPELPDSLGSRPDARELMQLNEIIVKACHPNPEHRCQTAAELHAALLRVQKELLAEPC